MNHKAQKSLEALWSSLSTLIEKKQAKVESPLLIGIGGQGGSGKSSVSHWLLKKINDSALLPLDDYRLPRKARASKGLLGSHPEGNDLARLRADLERARAGAEIHRPIFNPERGEADRTERVHPCRCLICDGEIAAHEGLRHQFDLFLLVESHWRTQLNARLSRDITERAYGLEKAIEVFLKSNLRDFPRFSSGASADADLILYRTTRGTFTVKKPLPQNG
ncbi:MAG: zeta toxin family protein [Puniceicoccales bacterium]